MAAGKLGCVPKIWAFGLSPNAVCHQSERLAWFAKRADVAEKSRIKEATKAPSLLAGRGLGEGSGGEVGCTGPWNFAFAEAR